MKKQIKKILGFVLAASVVLQAGAYAFGGTYPDHATAASGFHSENSTMTEWTPSDKDYTFRVGGKTFVLLDTDGEGNYFVLAEESYGKYPYSTKYDNSPVLETKSADGEETVYTDGPAKAMGDDWRFSTTETDSIGYWLNHGFLENGNGAGKALPESVKGKLIEKTWPVEGMKTVVDWTANSFYGEEQTKKLAGEYTKDNGYTAEGKLSLLSYTEYKKYQDIVGWVYSDVNWDGFMLRTPCAMLTSTEQSNELRYKFGSIQVKNIHMRDQASVDSKMQLFTNDSPKSANFHVRPVMWLDKDFFRTVACEVSSLGIFPKDEILKNSEEELSQIYSDAELADLKGGEKSWDWGHYPVHPSEFQTLTRMDTVIADVKKGASPAENLFTIGGRTFILLDRDRSGNYFVMTDEIYGNYQALTNNYINEQDGDKKTWTPDIWNFDPSQNDSLAFRMNSEPWGILKNNPFGYADGFNGNKDPKIIPEELLDDLMEYDWEIEPAYPDYSWKVQDAEYPQWPSDATTEQVKEEIRQWRDGVIKPNTHKTTVTAKLATMSYTEYETYKAKIGFQFYDPSLTWVGNFLRTPIAWVDGDGDTWKVTPGYLSINLNDSDNLKYNYAAITNNYMVRPVMWLKKDFFKNNKIDAATAGATVRAEMRDLYTAEDLKAVYTDEEIKELGIEGQEEPVSPISDITIKSGGVDVTDLSTVTEVTVAAKIAKTGAEQSAVMIAAVYDSQERLLAVNYDKIEFGQAETADASAVVEGFRNGAFCKAMLWTGLSENTLKPLCEAKLLPEV